MTQPTPCPACGWTSLYDDLAHTERLLSAIRSDADGRFPSAEAWMRLASLEDRIATVHWIDNLLTRPPFSSWPTNGGTDAFRSLRFLLSSLANDIEMTAIDPDSPMTELGQVPQPAPALYEEPAEPPRSTLEQLKDALGGVFK